MRRGRAEAPTRRSRPPDHPRFASVGVPVRIAVESNRLTDFQGQIIEFDRFWVKVRFEGKKPRLREGTGIGLQLGLPGREATLPLQGIVWRVDPDGVMTVLLSLSAPEFERLKSLAAKVIEERTPLLKPTPPRSWLDWVPPAGARGPWARPTPPEEVATPSPEAPEESVEAGGEPDSPSPAESVEESSGPAEPVEASAELVNSPPAPEEDAKAAPVDPLLESPEPGPVQQAGAARFFFEGLRAQPVNLSLWCTLGATMYHLGKKKAAAEILQHVVRHGRLNSREVRLAHSWLERLGAAAEDEAETRESGQPEVRGARSGPSPAQQAAVLAAHGDYTEAASLYYQAFRETVQAAPDDLLLWYALGVALSHLGRRWEATEAFRHVVRRGPPDSQEVRLAQLWLERGEVPADPTRVEPPQARPAVDPAPRTETRPPEVRRKPSGRAPVVEDEFGYFEADEARPTPGATPPSSQRGLPTAPPQPRARRAGPPEAPEVRARPAAPAPAPQGGGRAVPAARRGRAGPGPAEQAALLAAQGNYAEAARLYAEALRATPDKASLWYALGVTLRRLNRPQEAVEALQRVIRHGEPESLVRLARLWLERGGVGAEREDDTSGSSPRKGRPRRGGPDRDAP